jgi:hypothetical protein
MGVGAAGAGVAAGAAAADAAGAAAAVGGAAAAGGAAAGGLSTAGLVAGGLGAAGSIASGLLSSGAATSAAGIQAGAAQASAAQTMAMFNTTQANLAPFINLGKGAASELGNFLGIPAAPAATSAAPGTPGPMGPAGGMVSGGNLLTPAVVGIQSANGNPPGAPGSAFQTVGDLINAGITDLGNGTSLAQNSDTGAWMVVGANGTPTLDGLSLSSPLSAIGPGFGGSGGAAPAPAPAAAAGPPPPGFGAGVTPFPMPGTGGTPPVPGAPTPPPIPGAFAPTMDQLSQTPGYQFTLQQGEQAVQNSAAALGLGSSGPALKGAVNYAEGLAGTTYQQQFNNYWTNYQNQLNSYWTNYQGNFADYWANYQNQFNAYNTSINNVYNRLAGAVQQGGAAAAGQGTLGLNTTGQAGQFTTSAGAAQAAGVVGSTNALTAGVGGAPAAGVSNALLTQLLTGGNNPVANQLLGGMAATGTG